MELDFSKQISEAGKTGLWDNIRKKKQRMGKNYRPAKPGAKDRPSKEAWQKAQAAIELTYTEAEKKTLNKPFRLPSGSKKKFGVYVKNPKGNVVMVKFGDPNMEIKRDDPDRRKNFRARHQCDSNPGPKWKARYWSCKMWQGGKSVTQVTKGSLDEEIFEQSLLLQDHPELSKAQEIESPEDESMDYADEAADMAVSNLMAIKRNVAMIEQYINSSEDAKMEIGESWVAGKLVICDDYLNAVAKYLGSESAD